ncbi:MAG: hypothetical protein P8N02_15390 [Actinomycetota bacterium]|nr:hypothetical protein [Actinomycetota bacterium]
MPAPTTTTLSTTTVAPTPTIGAPTTTGAPQAVLPAGVPGTWFGTYTDLETGLAHAVEVDTASGDIVRTLVSYSTGECEEYDASGECVFFLPGIAPVSIDVSATQVAVGICCEPAAGWTRVLDRATGDEVASTFGSEPALADFATILATAAYADGGAYLLTDTSSGTSSTLPLVIDWGDSLDWAGGLLAMEVDNGVGIWVWDGSIDAEGDATPMVSPDDPARSWANPTFAASGNLVVAEHATEGEGESLGVVLDTSGGFTLAVDSLILATFPYGGRVVQQTYDASGTFLIYTLSDGSVRWQGKGQSGILMSPGSDFSSASWH